MITYEDFCKAYSVKHVLVLDALIEQVKACTGDEFGYLSDVKRPEEMSEAAFKNYITILRENGHIEMTGIEDGYEVLVEGCFGKTAVKEEYEWNRLNAKIDLIENANKTFRGQLEEKCNEIDDLHEQRNDMVNFLIEQAEKWSAGDLRDRAIEMIGKKEYLRRKIEKGFNLWAVDKEMLMEVLAD